MPPYRCVLYVVGRICVNLCPRVGASCVCRSHFVSMIRVPTRARMCVCVRARARADNQHYAEVPIGSGVVPDRNFGQMATEKQLLGCSDRDVNAVVKRQVARVPGVLESVAREIRLVSNSLVGYHAAKEERSAPPALCPPGQGTTSTACSICMSGDAYGRSLVNSTQFPSGTLEFNAGNGAAVLNETGAWIPKWYVGPAGFQRPPKVKNTGEITVETTLFHGDPAFDQNDFVAVHGYNPDMRDHTTVIQRTARFTVKEGYYYTYGLNGAVTEYYDYPGTYARVSRAIWPWSKLNAHTWPGQRANNLNVVTGPRLAGPCSPVLLSLWYVIIYI